MRTRVTAKGLATAAIAALLFLAAGLYASHRTTMAHIERGNCGITPEAARQEALNYVVVHAAQLRLSTYPKDGDLKFVERDGTCMYTFAMLGGTHRADIIVYDNYPHTAVAVTSSGNATRP
jgi:hypothetical protein